MDNNTCKKKSTCRIQYIDAMRGFTIFLVVMTHVSTFGLGFSGSDTFTYNDIFGTFRMPLFFFISGFVLYKADSDWNFNNTFNFIKKKISVQLIGPLLFLVASAVTRKINFMDALFDFEKAGYWFTFTLFEFYLLYIFSQQIVRLFKANNYMDDMIIVAIACFFYIAKDYISTYNLDKGVGGLLGIPTLYRYLFFVLGTRVKKYFVQFENMLDATYATAILLVTFIFFNLFPGVAVISNSLYSIVVSVCGLFLVFAFFRRYQSVFTSSKIGIIMQFLGRRTLDIYLIHYFFIFSNLTALLPNMSKLNSPFIEFLLSIIISVAIVMCCLLVSFIIRLSPILGHILFGVKLQSK